MGIIRGSVLFDVHFNRMYYEKPIPPTQSEYPYYYVSTTGDDTWPGSSDYPWKTLRKGFESASLSDNGIIIRGGSYYITDNDLIYVSNIDGTSEKSISVSNYTNENVIIDCTYLTSSNDGMTLESCSYWDISGLTVRNVQTGSGIHLTHCGNIGINDIVTHDCSDDGIEFSYVQDPIIVYNSDSYNNTHGYQTKKSFSTFLDTFAAMSFIQCRAWDNTGSGFDLGEYDGYITLDNCWSFDNSISGFALGAGVTSTDENRYLKKCLSFGNDEGFHYYGNPGTMKFYNCTSYDNDNLGYTLVREDILYNNISYQDGITGSFGTYTGTNNNWDYSVVVTDDDFESLDSSSMSGVRRATNNDLPILYFLRPTMNSDLVDAGVDVGLDYNYTAPDIGCFEYSSSIAPDPLITYIWTGTQDYESEGRTVLYPLTFESHTLESNYSPSTDDWFQYETTKATDIMNTYYDSSRGDIVTHGATQALRLTYPNTWSSTSSGSKSSGGYWRTQFSSTVGDDVEREEVYLTYNFFVPDDWDWSEGMKLPGLRVGFLHDWETIEQPTGYAGSYVILHANSVGNLRFYHYEHIMDGGPNPVSGRALQDYGYMTSIPDATIQTGQWNNITIRLVLNTATDELNTTPQENGFAECFIDGVYKGRLENVIWRERSDVFIDTIEFSAFMGTDLLGGDTPSWAPSTEQYAWFDDIQVFHYENIPENFEVPKGFTESPTNRTILNELSNFPKSYTPVPEGPPEYVELFVQDFTDSDYGVYNTSDVQTDFGDYIYSNGIGWEGKYNCNIIDNEVGGQSLYVLCPAGGISPDNGVQFNKLITDLGRTELYMTYNVKWTPSTFDPKLGGKLPGLMTKSSDPDTHPSGGGGTGFNARLVWKENGSLAWYLYWPDQTTTYGYNIGGRWPDPDDLSQDFSFFGRDWTNITMRVVMNDYGQSNGFLEGFINGILVSQQTGLRLIDDPAIVIDEMSIVHFWGGNTLDYAPDIDMGLEIDDIHLFYFDGSDDEVPLSGTPSVVGRDMSKWLPSTNKGDNTVNITTLFQEDYSDSTLDNYWYSGQWSDDFGNGRLLSDGNHLELPWAQNTLLTRIVDVNGHRCIRSVHPEGAWNPGNDLLLGSGLNSQPEILTPSNNPSNYEEAYFSYSTLFSNDFDIPLSMKSPGLNGGGWFHISPGPGYDSTSGRTIPSPGYFYNYNWGAGMGSYTANDYSVRGYIYHHDKMFSGHTYGETLSPNINYIPRDKGKWYNVTIRCVMNSIRDWTDNDIKTLNPTQGAGNEFYYGDEFGNLWNGTPATVGNSDGIYEIFINGILTTQKTNVRWRNLPTQGIDKMKVYTHHGGGTIDFAPSNTCYMYLDDFALWYYPINPGNSEVPIGRTASSIDRDISTELFNWPKDGSPPIPPNPDPEDINEILGKGFCGYNITPNDGTMTMAWTGTELADLETEGVDNVRIVAYYFNDNNSSPWTINTSTLENLKDMIDEINSHGMMAIIDYHQPMLKRNNLYTEYNKDRFVSHWGQLATYFTDYSTSQIVYELLNEPEYSSTDPNSQMTADDWNDLAQRAVTEIRLYDTKKAIMVTPHGWSKMEGLRTFTVPTDPNDNMILSIHYYNPRWMIIQGASWTDHGDEFIGADWPVIEPMNDVLESEFQVLEDFRSANNNIPVTIGEFGTYNAFIDEDHRYNYLNHLARFFDSKGYSWSHWDFDQDFGIYDGGWNTENLKDGLLHDALPSFEPYSSTTLYQSDFSSTTDGFTKSEANGGAVTLSVSGGKLVCNVTNGGSSSTTDVTIFSPSHTATKGSIYRVSYTISGTKSFCADKLNDRFSWHNIYDLASGGSYSRVYTYWMAYDTDASNHVSFLIGGSTGIFYIENLKIEEISTVVLPFPDDKEIIFSIDFEDSEIQDPYTYANIQNEWPWETNWTDGRGRSSYVGGSGNIDNVAIAVEDGSNVMLHRYGADKWGVGTSGAGDGTGINGHFVFAKGYDGEVGEDEIYFSYNVKFSTGFDWGLGGKLPGVTANPYVDGGHWPPDNDEGGFNIMMWQPDGYAKLYDYVHVNIPYQYPYEYGRGPNIGQTFVANVWYNVTQRFVQSDPIAAGSGGANGIHEVFIDGILVHSWTGILTREYSYIHFNAIEFATFQGGGEDYQTPGAYEAYFDDIDLWKITGTGTATHPVGNTASPTGRDITSYITMK